MIFLLLVADFGLVQIHSKPAGGQLKHLLAYLQKVPPWPQIYIPMGKLEHTVQCPQRPSTGCMCIGSTRSLQEVRPSNLSSFTGATWESPLGFTEIFYS